MVRFGRRALLTAAGAAAMFGLPAARPIHAQTPAGAASFEVASIKPGDPSDRRISIGLHPGGRFTATNVPLKFLIMFAWHVQDFQVTGGPGWINTDKYVVEAKSSDDSPADLRSMTDEQRQAFEEKVRLRMQTLLEDRFKLKLHRETKEMPVYELVVAKNGPKLTPSAQDNGKGPRGMRMGRGQLNGTAATTVFLAQVLSNQVGRVVTDKTGLTGNYDFKLEWTPDPGQQAMGPMGPPPGPGGNEGPPPADANGPSLFTAIQEQLGLKLQPAKGPVEVLVIDSAEKPSDN